MVLDWAEDKEDIETLRDKAAKDVKEFSGGRGSLPSSKKRKMEDEGFEEENY